MFSFQRHFHPPYLRGRHIDRLWIGQQILPRWLVMKLHLLLLLRAQIKRAEPEALAYLVTLVAVKEQGHALGSQIP